MSILMKTMMAAAFTMAMPLICSGQTENPRGIYKMITIHGKNGEIPAPFDQYKICTDSVTLQVAVGDNGAFLINNNDRRVFYYTGDTPKNEDDKSTLIYNSNSQHFIEKWWSPYSNHPVFPKNDWCLEYYESGKFSDTAKPFFEALTTQAQSDKSNPFIGTWYSVGTLNDLKNAKKQVKELQKNTTQGLFDKGCTIFTPTHIVGFAPVSSPTAIAIGVRGASMLINYQGKKSFISSNPRTITNVSWVSKDCALMERHIGSRTVYEVFVRSTDKEPLIKPLVGLFIEK